ncbi:MAG: helix-turn-helix domain-containing protein [Betaproteobacteria bacterium]|jgi:cytoskeleton protein RodZ|uniref:Helix-turn-helix domain-containing protein n=1 Tax=Candidatus Proximibacter danicus TaxID=2954365 RepID=A0A9D7JZQ8_9PROT|nr:helix-turn-helix domain-containing protein [Candidatus Proximibacter danicus]MBK9446701.1 helix-turn-helix domain-containing protein [Betaproteobacteria bacterium]
MSEISPEEPVVEVVAKPDVGERLRAAREALGLDVEAVAASLKLSKRQIDALEAGDWSKLPGHTFIRGFVRNYARVVKLDAAALLEDLDAPPPTAPQLDLPQNTSAVLPQRGQAQKRDYAAVLGGIVLVTVAVVAYYVVPPDFWQPARREVPPAVAAEPAPLFPPSGLSMTDTVPSAVVSGEAISGVASIPATALVAVSTDSGKRLKMRFAQPSWVEIRDASGQTIYSQLNPAGSEREIEGQPPYVMVVGNAAHVTVSYQGRNIELQPRSKDDVARVTVE